MTDPWVLAIWSPWVVFPLLNWLLPEPRREVGDGWVAVDRRYYEKG